MKFHVATDKIDLADELEEDFRKEGRVKVRKGTDMAVREIKDTLRRTGSRASRPNEPPAMRTGELERSIKRGRVRLGRDKLSVIGEVVSDLTYEEVNSVEYGHTKPSGHRVLPRPFIRPAMATVEPKIAALFEEGA